MTVQPSNFKNGMCIKYNNKLCTIVEFQHVKPGKGGAFVRTKLKDLSTGRVVDYTFRPTEKFDDVRLETKEMEYSWNDGETYYFMDPETYEQPEIPASVIGDDVKWLKEGDTCLAAHRGASHVRGDGSDRNRAWLQGQHRAVRHQARHA